MAIQHLCADVLKGLHEVCDPLSLYRLRCQPCRAAVLTLVRIKAPRAPGTLIAQSYTDAAF